MLNTEQQNTFLQVQVRQRQEAQSQERQSQETQEEPTPPNPHQQSQPALQNMLEFATTLISANVRAGKNQLASEIMSRLQIQVSEPTEATLTELVALINSKPAHLRKGLSSIAEFIHQQEIGDTAQENLRLITPDMQLVSMVREETQTFLREFTKHIWQEMYTYLSKGYIPFPIEQAETLNKSDKFPALNDEFIKIPINSSFPTVFSAETYQQAMCALCFLVDVTASHFVLREINNRKFSSEIEKTDQILALRHTPFQDKHNTYSAMKAGFGAGITNTLASFVTLIDIARLDGHVNCLTANQLSRVVDEHRKFLLQLATWGFQQFADFVEMATDQVEPSMAEYQKSILNYEGQSYWGKKLKAKYFRCQMHITQDGSVPTLDLNPSGFTPNEILNLTVGIRRFGCPALPVLPEFTDWLLNAFVTVGLKPRGIFK